MLTIEIFEHELLPLSKKWGWLGVTWLIPIVGPVCTYCCLKVGWPKGPNSGGSNILPPGDGGL